MRPFAGVFLVTAMVWSGCLAIAAVPRLLAAAEEESYTETVQIQGGKTLSFEMVRVPAGEFQMGSPDEEAGRREDEGPRVKVLLPAFYLATTETTLELFLAYYQETVRTPTFGSVDAVTGPTPVYGDMTMGRSHDHPAIGMTWENAVRFCEWLSEKTGREYRLPTEAEWEYACRAGSEDRHGVDENVLKEYAWLEKNSGKNPHPVGRLKANAFGLFDMLGNVEEWVHDRYSAEAYAANAASGSVASPQGPSSGRLHVARGGHYRSPPEEARCASRNYERRWWREGDPQVPKSTWWLPFMDHIGFRVARSAVD